MKRVSPQLRSVAQRLMAYEASRNASSRTGDPPFPVLERLRPALATLMGKAGFRGLLARSIAAASEEVRWLRAVHVKSDGSLTGLQELQAQLAPALFFEGHTLMLAQLLGSLVVFIGDELTLQLVRDAWPKLSLTHLDFGKGDKSETTRG
jgi:hypothetical protein